MVEVGCPPPLSALSLSALPAAPLGSWHALQVDDTSLALLHGDMGYSLEESRRALRFGGGDVARAVQFITDQRQQEEV